MFYMHHFDNYSFSKIYHGHPAGGEGLDKVGVMKISDFVECLFVNVSLTINERFKVQNQFTLMVHYTFQS